MGLINYTNIEDGTPITANVFNQRFAQIISVINGGLGSENFTAGGIPPEALNPSVFERMYPVGSIYINASVNTNPNTLFGFGTWEAFGTGRVLVGLDESQTEFNAVNKTGGNKNLQSHSHTGTTSTNGNHSHNVTNRFIRDIGGNSGNLKQTAGGAPMPWQNLSSIDIDANGNHNHTFTTDSAGSGDSGNLQPFITVYMWRRTG